tara:strand:- start:18442 stop:18819 length:378 start_codon:yes stop_codon:yes gene_type:complete
MYDDDQLRREAMAQDFQTNDTHRRRILFTSMQGKLSSANLMLDAAIEAAAEARGAYASGDEATAQRNAEAVFAAVEEVLQSLNMVKMLSTKAGSDRPIPPMAKYQNAVANLGQPGTAPAQPNASQ